MSTSNLSNGRLFNLDQLFDLTPDLICIAGFDGYFKQVNQSVCTTLGYTIDELLSRPINDFIHHDDKTITETNRENLRNNIPLLDFENRYITKSNDVVWLSWTSMPVDNQKIVFAIAKNITHKKKLEDERSLELVKLSKQNKNLKQLIYTASHDLRAPVNNLLSVFSLLDSSNIQDEETLDFLTVFKNATDNLKNTMNNYIDVLKNKEELHIATEELSLSDCFKRVLQSLDSMIQASKTQVTSDFSVYDRIDFHEGYLESIYLNLLTNAIKYCKPYQNPVISVHTSEQNGRRQLIFSDKGRGFDMDKVKDRIFGFNQQFHNHADSKGIGLYLIHNYVTSLGGNIAVESGIDEGAKFTITFK